jgi:hypothetical protein
MFPNVQNQNFECREEEKYIEDNTLNVGYSDVVRSSVAASISYQWSSGKHGWEQVPSAPSVFRPALQLVPPLSLHWSMVEHTPVHSSPSGHPAPRTGRALLGPSVAPVHASTFKTRPNWLAPTIYLVCLLRAIESRIIICYVQMCISASATAKANEVLRGALKWLTKSGSLSYPMTFMVSNLDISTSPIIALLS